MVVGIRTSVAEAEMRGIQAEVDDLICAFKNICPRTSEAIPEVHQPVARQLMRDLDDAKRRFYVAAGIRGAQCTSLIFQAFGVYVP